MVELHKSNLGLVPIPKFTFHGHNVSEKYLPPLSRVSIYSFKSYSIIVVFYIALWLNRTTQERIKIWPENNLHNI